MPRLATPPSIETAPAAVATAPASGSKAARRRAESVSSGLEQPGRARRLSRPLRRAEQRIAAGGDPRAHRARDRRDQRLRLLPLRPHLSRQKHLQARRCRDDRQSQRRLQRSQGGRRRPVRRQGRARARACERRRCPRRTKMPVTTMRRSIEIVLHVALNTWTNYINTVAKTEIDFPVVTAVRRPDEKFAARICGDRSEQSQSHIQATSPSRHGQGGADAQRLAPRLCQDRGERFMANAHHARSRGVHRSADEHFPGDRESRRAALYPASRRAGRISESARRQDHRLRRFRRQPAIHHARQSRRQSESLSVPDRLCASPPHQALGRSARGRRRRRADRQS